MAVAEDQQLAPVGQTVSGSCMSEGRPWVVYVHRPAVNISVRSSRHKQNSETMPVHVLFVVFMSSRTDAFGVPGGQESQHHVQEGYRPWLAARTDVQ